MITHLTAEQEAKFPEYVKKWTEIGGCTKPADRVNAEKAINVMYKIAGLYPPKIIWCGSPLGNALTRAIVIKIASVGDSVWASV
ncbi:MAG: hypothetical protein JRI72_00005, partial [Deltaproteobacteria bacterium]|nr:hypothetical protein [Deltaproteobacteria bacterium]